jgi:hypothetical protein
MRIADGGKIVVGAQEMAQSSDWATSASDWGRALDDNRMER